MLNSGWIVVRRCQKAVLVYNHSIGACCLMILMLMLLSRSFIFFLSAVAWGMAFPPRRKTVRTCRSWQSDPWLQPGEKFCGGLWNGQSVWSQIVCDPFPGELRIVLARGEGGKGKKWETHSSGILQYCSASIRPLQTSTKLTFNDTTKFNHLQLQGLVQKYGIAANPTELLKRPGQPRTPEAWSWVGPGSAGSW